MVENNYISGIDKRLCVMDGWMNGNVRDFGCDATTSATGRRVYENQECNQCGEEGALFYGQTMCGEREAVMTEREILQLLFDATNGRTWSPGTLLKTGTRMRMCASGLVFLATMPTRS